MSPLNINCSFEQINYNIICQEAIKKNTQTLDCKQVARKYLSCFTLVPFMESLTKSVYDIAMYRKRVIRIITILRF